MPKGYPVALNQLISTFAKLPGVGEKTAQRFSLFLLSHPELCETLGDLIKELPYRVKLCKICRNFSENDLCSICQDDTREKEVLCIVENPVTLHHIEATGVYRGYYFVLHYLLSPKDGIGPKEIGLDELTFLIKTRGIKEVFIALSPTMAGEATATYILQHLKNEPVKITRLACGVPMGMEIQFVDPLTLKKAITGRECLKNE
ncbi:MAG: recombination protein RecR [Thermodesulfobacteria bacterium]|nr:recombination protein RecR [Thermodesulfobacteriota bacterium]